ncbi:MAG: UDP-N-acetylmuramoyl-L-alanyl-D-glutamate--2,6-diaminopimelate ligase [Clostridia bacterium]|nr:UDP-N-acetylmuramoyl-L-alanyl-D-glutamate--2,6-diaminopimelate ligase [Clostridia bacterium]
MTVKEVIDGLEIVKVIGKTDAQVKDVCIDSNSVVKDSLFICIKGENFDGHSFINQVQKYGAVAIVTEKYVRSAITQIIVKNTRKAMGKIASNFYGKPEKELKLIGVTGTNGKTTTAHLIYNILNANGIKCGVIGTLGTYYSDKFIQPNLTTPDPLNLYKIFREMVDNGVKAVSMEVSAHALYLDKLDGIDFEVGIFTNLTQDHLDFFENMEEYKKAKQSFFFKNKIKYAVLNSDDKVSFEISQNKKNVLFYGIDNPSDVFAIDIEQMEYATHFVINIFDAIHVAKIKLKGLFNVYNSLAAATACALLGVKTKNIVSALSEIANVSGRLETVYSGDFTVMIDYAHTPDGLEKCLTAIRETCKGKLICVFGCGGNRDVDKREIMGEISGKFADFTVITSDNPRYEEPMDIIWQIEKGILKHTKKYVIVQDRVQGIEYALKMAKEKDVVVVAGKGSENYQEIFGIKKPYNDKDTINNVIRSIN